MQAVVFNVQRFSIQDGPGIRTTVFFKGCPLRCRWCHNPEGQVGTAELLFREYLCRRCFTCRAACPVGAIVELPHRRVDRARCIMCMVCAEACPYGALSVAGTSAPVEALLAEVCRDVAFYRTSGGGVTASGGEPLAQYQAVIELFAACRARAIHTALDTCGYAPWEILAAVEPHVDLFLYDLKCVDEERHRLWTGVGNQVILENLRRLAKLRAGDIRIRIPLVAGFNDDRRELEAMVHLVSSLSVQGVDVLPYHSFAESKYRALDMAYSLEGLEDYPWEEAERKAELFGEATPSVTVGG